MLANLLAWWGWINPHIQCVLPVLVFVIGGKCVKGLVLLYWLQTAYNMLVSLLVGENQYLCAAWAFVRGLTPSMGEPGEILLVFENFSYPWSIQASVLAALCFLNVCQILFWAMRYFSNNSTPL